ncbi:cyclic nucleotide-binding domain-containing protein [Nodularia sphaerocarpa]|uniref:cyclic nucleotide-binding domain-containing protein n=2 Tax=Nodularia sphaerocarpa TaxID=137816 RepID=UPI001EFB03F1|nr:cyclic nucleotide-binding domain-containing protein [Nodularia sphaerocarpa]MDB9375857.1 cyclic nucleotide-binding domain-containing protein [Nodularia sphaerocarpa CS-585]ULP71826.1 DNA-binding transcriptional activator HyfR [Nodularia sphaerocarpa UHCC 0038]
MTSPETVIWLQERTPLGILSPAVLDAIAQVLESKIFPAESTLVSEGTSPAALYILQQGQLESKTNNKNNAALACGFLPGAIVQLKELLLDELTSCTVTTVTECHLWVISAAQFRALVAQYPEISQAFSRLLAQELAEVTSALGYEQERAVALRPYLVTKAQRGIVGTSRYAVRLREQIRAAASTGESVEIFGEPGLEKDNIAALIHYGSPKRREAIIKVNCGILQTSGMDLFGRAGGKPGLLEWLGSGTIVFNNIQELPPELLPSVTQLLKTGKYSPVTRSGEPPAQPRPCKARVIIVSEKTQSDIERCIDHRIKVPPLRVRKTDIQAQVEYYTSLYIRGKGLSKPKITPEALRRLQSYDFPGNVKELKNLVERAIVQVGDGRELTEEIFWSAQTQKKQLRLNLLNAYPGLRKFLRSPWWPDRINYGFTFAAFAAMIAILFMGPQTRDRNFILNFFWAWWWPFFLFLFPFLGRIWCSVCPFMIYGEITQKLSLWLFPRKLQGWPRQKAEKWGGWFMFGLFTLIFLWEELWDLQNTAYLSACLLLLITAGAMIFSAIFERRFWCRYLCPIGGMNGLFAKLSMTELRAQQGICSASCNTYQCYKGGPEKGEGLETNGCPVYSHPAQLQDNRDCVLCMTCLKACPHRSVEFNLRPPAIELWTTHTPHSYEVALLFLLLGGVYLHRLPELQSWLGLQVDLSLFWQHLGLSLLILLIPTAVIFAAYGLMQLTKFGRKPRPFLQLTYGYLPLVLGGNLAHYLRLGLGEAGRILPVTLATFGLNGEQLPILVAHPAVIDFLQGATLIFSVLLTIILTQKIARQPIRALFWQHLAAIGLGISMWAIIVA